MSMQSDKAEIDQATVMAAQPRMVLVVDDDPSMLRSVTRLLEVHGFATKAFSSAEAVLEMGVPGAATCLLLDINLGGISGIELYRQLSEAGSKLPIIFMTAIDDDAIERVAMEAGCVAYLRKPFPASQLLDAIEKAAA
jgi:FixJ family two-component response regulator